MLELNQSHSFPGRSYDSSGLGQAATVLDARQSAAAPARFKGPMRNRISAGVLLGLYLLIAGCTRTPKETVAPGPVRPGAVTTAPVVPGSIGDAAFTRLAEEYLAGYLAWRPQIGTALGWHEYAGRMTDYRRESLDRELGRLLEFQKRLEALNTRDLSGPAYYDYRILLSSIQREIFGFKALRIYTQNPMTYAGALDVNIYIKRNWAPFEDRLRSVIALLNQAPQIMAAARANLDESLPRPLIETAIEVAGGAADFLSKDLAEAVQDMTDKELVRAFRAANERAIAELRGYVTYLKVQKLPKANERYALGRLNYAEMLRCGTLVSLAPEQVLELGLRELKQEQRIFAETARRIDQSREPVAVFREIQQDHPTEQNLIPDTRRDLEAIRQFVVGHRIVTLPSEVRVQVAETPQFMRATSFASMDTPGPFETKATEAYYYVTPVEKDWPSRQKEQWLTAFNYYTTDVVSIHEVYPGHYVQFLCLNASPATKLEKVFNNYAFIEGWAHYAEQMMLDQGFGASPASSMAEQVKAAKFRLAQSDEALLRLCRLCVSVKIHCQGLTVDEATRFFRENCYAEEQPARQEAMRGVYDPEYLYYTLGKLQILKLREDYRKQEGEAFTLEKFHNEVLRHGAPPVRLLREVLLKDRRGWNEVF